MHKSATKCNEILGKWCKNKHGASKIIDTFWTYQAFPPPVGAAVRVGDYKQSQKFIDDVDAHGVPRPAAHRRAASWVL
jgi:hypothetical protein